jgi:hypothetical protein
MILKGNQRGGGQQLAAHLQNSFDNERVEIADVRGSVAQDLSGAFAEWAAEARGTKCTKFLYSLSLNPYQPNGRLTREQYLDLLERTERSLKLVGQPRAVVFHEKRDKDGMLREHCHAVWSRIDTDRMKAVQMSHDRLKLRTVAQEFARDHGLELPDGMKRGNTKDSRKERFNNRAAQENLGEKQQQERTGVPKEVRMAEISGCWTGTTNGAAFVHALEGKSYYLARGDQRDYVIIDAYGEIHSLSRQLSGVAKKKELMDRLADYPPAGLRDAETVQAQAREKLQERRKAQEAKGEKATEGNKQEAMDAKAAEGNKPEASQNEATPVEQRTSALHARQQQRRDELGKHRLDLHARQFRERAALRDMQADHHADVAAERQGKQPKGLAAFLTRVTGIGRFVAWAQDKADRKREAAHRHETDALLRRHTRELKEMERHYGALDRLESRENRAAANAGLREEYRKLRARSFALKPEFEKAMARQEPAGTSGGGSKAPGLFNRLASGIGLTKGDLQAAFERATAGKTVRKEDTDTAGHAPVDAEKLERARQLRDDLSSRQPRPGPDRDRER